MQVEHIELATVIPFAKNSRIHNDAQVAQIAASIREFGFTNPVLIDEANGIIAGHGRVLAARKLKLTEVPCIRLVHLTDAQKRAYVIADNKLALNAGWDEDLLALEIKDLQGMDFDLDLLGFDTGELDELLFGDEQLTEGQANGSGKLSDKFLIAPFSVLNAREGWWQERKRAWIAMGIESEKGRGDNLLQFSETAKLQSVRQRRRSAQIGGMNKKNAKIGKTFGAEGNASDQTGTSIFDPVLCELSYRWFSPAGGVILDPFAGGSVRGIVAAKLGRQYIGGELRREQVDANREQADSIIKDSEPIPVWHCGDSRNIDKVCKDVQADFVYSCPPYADLEVYSDDPADLSSLPYEEFRAAYFEIIKKTCGLLKNDRFACFVVGEVRDKKGNYYDFVGDTVQAFRDAGLAYYNEAILVTAVGSLPIRAGKQFSASRKLGKTHQNVLIFVKGDGKKAAQACGEVEISDEAFQLLQRESLNECGLPYRPEGHA